MENKYIPLYRKYRPQTFKDLIGQENIVNTLSNAIKLNKISHAYLFCGPRGTGKTSSARIFAKSLNCINGPTVEPCGKCPSCLDIANAVPVDVIEIDAASNRSVEDAHEILSKIQYVPVNGKYKIYVIDEVHMLTNYAFNALLKTIEEPPENVVFILATTEPHKVLDTIISRCQRFDFKRITTDDIVKRLKYIAEKEEIKITDNALCTIAKNSQGGMRDSLALLDQVSVLGYNKEIDVEDINEILGRVSFDFLYEIVGDISTSNCLESINLIDKIYNRGNEPIQIISNLIQYFRDLIIAKNCKDKQLILNMTNIAEVNFDKAKEQGELFSVEEIIQIIDSLSYYATQIKDSTNKYLWMELCLIALTNYKNLPSPTNLLKRIEVLEEQLANGNIKPAPQKIAIQRPIKPVEATIPQPKEEKQVLQEGKPTIPAQVPQEAQEEIKEEVQEPIQSTQSTTSDKNEIHSLWVSIVQNIKSTPAKAFYRLAKPVSIDGNKITISFSKEMFIKQSKEDSKRLPLIEAAEEYLNTKGIVLNAVLGNMQSLPTLQSNVKISSTPPSTVQKEEEEETANETSEEDAAYYAAQSKQEMPPQEIDTSSQVSMVKELFDGKII